MATLNPVQVIPATLKPGDVLGFKVIALIGYAGDWAAYEGLTSWTDDEVAALGDKISQKAAEALFSAPQLLRYRWE